MPYSRGLKPPSPPPSPEPSLTDRVTRFYKQLSVTAVDLNAASDELGKSITALDAALRKLNLGVSTWVRVVGHEGQHGNFWVHKLGYAKVASRWGIALRTVQGNYGDPEGAEAEEWLFNDAPRALRIEAVDKIPDLLEQLIKEASSTSQKIKEKTVHAQELAMAIMRAASSVAQPRK